MIDKKISLKQSFQASQRGYYSMKSIICKGFDFLTKSALMASYNGLMMIDTQNIVRNGKLGRYVALGTYG